MRKYRLWTSALSLIALAALFLKLPETPNIFNLFECKACVSNNPYVPLIGAGYFSTLIALSLFFPAFPNRQIARGGLTWAVLLAIALTWVDFPSWCGLCLVGHACNILIWTIWLTAPSEAEAWNASPMTERLCLTLFAPVSMVALFACLNLTFMIYNLKNNHNTPPTSLKPGDTSPAFAAKGTIINFVIPDCPYCKQQLPILNSLAAELSGRSYRFITISPELTAELSQEALAIEWLEDKDGKLRELFKVSGFPILFVVGNDGKIAEIIPGAPAQLKSLLSKAIDFPLAQ